MVQGLAMARRVMVAALLLLLLAVPTSAATNAWTRLTPPTSMRRFPAHWVDCSPTVTSGNPVGRSYSSMINGPSGKLLYWGGGHGSHPGNDAEIFDTATQTWTEQFTPECLESCCQICSDNSSQECVTSANCSAGATCIATKPICTGSGRCGVPYCNCNVANGAGTTQLTQGNRPFTEHSYQSYGYNPAKRHYLLSLTSGTWSYSPPDTWTHLTSTQPPLAGRNSVWGAGKAVVYDPDVTCGPDTGAMLLIADATNRGVYCFDYSQSLWVAYDVPGQMPSVFANQYELTTTYDSSRHRHVVSFSTAGVWLYDAVHKTWTNTNAPAGALQTISSFFNEAVAYDSAHDVTVVLKPVAGASPDMWQYDNATGAWSDIDDTQLGTLPPAGSTAKWNTWRYDGGTFYFLATGGVGGSGQGGTPDNVTQGATTWTFQWSNPPLVGTPTPTPATGPIAAPLTWTQRAAQTGVLAAIGFHTANEVSTYATVSGLTGQGPVYDAAMDAARFPIINTLPAAQFNSLDNYAWSGALTYSLPWAQQFDENSEFEVQYLFRDDSWVTELTNKKIDIWGAGDRSPSVPAVTGGPALVGSCMPNDVVTEFYQNIGTAHVGLLSGYQGCSSGPAWGNSYAGQIGVNFSDFSPPRTEYWYQPAIPSCLYSRVNAGTAGVCTVIGANVWQAVTMHFKLGPRGANPAFAGNPAYGPNDWFTNSYFWMAFGWEGHPSTALIYRGPFYYYSPISDLGYGNPPPKIGKLWLFPYRQATYEQVRASAMTSTTVTVTGADIPETFPAGASVTDQYTGYTTLTADAHPGDTTISVADTSSLHSPISALRLWRHMNAGSRWFKEVLIASGSTLADPFGTAPIVWPTPPNSAAAWPGLTPPPSGEIPISTATRPSAPVLLP